MRGNPTTLIAVGIGVVSIPLVLDIDVSGDATGQTIQSLLASVGPLVSLAFVVACFGLLVAYFTDSGF